jgi:hypothetical protein
VKKTCPLFGRPYTNGARYTKIQRSYSLHEVLCGVQCTRTFVLKYLTNFKPLFFRFKSRYSAVSRASRQRHGRYGVRIPGGSRDFLLLKKFRAHCEVNIVSHQMGNMFFSGGVDRRSVMLSIHPHLAPTLRMSGAIHLLPLDTFMSWTGMTLT